MRTVCPSWILTVACAGLAATAVGCGDNDPTRIECPAGYLAFRVEADSDQYVCTKAAEAVCENEELVPLLLDDGAFVCMEPRTCGEDDVAIQQEDGTYRCVTTIQVECDDGKVAMEAANGSFACVDEIEVECSDDMVPLATGNVVTCVTQPQVSCDDNMVAVLADNGMLACIEIDSIECDDGLVAMEGSDGLFACVEIDTIECDDGLLPVQAGNGTVSCVSQVNLSCDDGMVPVETASGLFACMETAAIECEDGAVPVQGVDGDVSCVAVAALDCEEGTVPTEISGVYSCVAPVEITCPEGMVPTTLDNSTYACRNPLTVACEAGQVTTQQDDGTYACLGLDNITCPSGTILTQQGNATFACSAGLVDDINPGTIGCPAGTVLSDSLGSGQLACVRLEQLDCPADYVMTRAATGAWQCVSFQAGDDQEIVASGRVQDQVTDIPLAGVQVTLLGLVDVDGATIVTTTDENGYFNASGFAVGRQVTAALALDGYLPSTEVHTFNVDTSAVATITQPDDFSFSPGGFIELTPVPANDLVVAGTLIANQAIAAGVEVQLLSCATSAELTQYAVQSVTSGTDGTFVFEAVPDGCYTVNVGQYDIDGNGTPDYRVQEVNLGTLSSASQDIGNLQIVLDPTQVENMVFTSLRLLVNPPGGEVPSMPLADMIGETYLMPDDDTEITFQLSAPIDPGSIIVELYALDDGAVVEQLAVTATAAASTLTVTTGDLPGDSDPDTLYALRFRQLAWANGEYIQLPTGGNGSSDIFFDVRTPGAYLPNPTALALYWGSNVDAATGVIDSGNAWDLASSGLAIDDRAFGAVQMSWTLATGATEYRLFARWSNDDGDYTGQTWEEIQTFGAFGESNIGTTAWGTVDLPSIFTSANWASPSLAWGHTVQLTLASVNAVGDVTPVDPANALELSDSVLLGLDLTTSATLSSNNLDSPATELEYDLTFSEDIRSTFSPVVTPLAATSGLRADDDWEWDSADPWQDTGTLSITVTDERRDACALVNGTVTHASGQDYFTLDSDDTDLFAAGDDLIAFSQGNPQMNNGSLITVDSVFNDTIWTEATLAGRSDGATPPNYSTALNDGDWVCTGTFPTTTGAEAMGAITLSAAGSASDFYIGQSVCFVPTSDDPVECAVVQSIDYAGNRLFFEYLDIDPADDTNDTNALLNPPSGSRVIRMGDNATSFAGVMRHAEEIEPIQSVAANTTTIALRVDLGDLEALGVAPGDRVLIDLDGDAVTTADRSLATVAQVARQLDTTDDSNTTALTENIVVNAVTPAYGAGATITEDSIVILLGNTAMTITNMGTAEDSSGNSPQTSLYDQFAVCVANITDSEGNTICNAGETFVF